MAKILDTRGLKWQFQKTNGIDTIVLVNDSPQDVAISALWFEANISIGVGLDQQRNLTDDATAEVRKGQTRQEDRDKPIEEKRLSDMKVHLFRERMWDLTYKKKMDDGMAFWTVADVYLNPWGTLCVTSQDDGVFSRTSFSASPVYLYQVEYKKPRSIAANLQKSLSYVSSFACLEYGSYIKNLSTLPKVWVRFPDQSDPVQVPLDLINLQMSGKRRRTIDSSSRNIIKSAAFSRRALGYYANYFGYGRDVFIRDLPFEHINEISYGMFSMDLNGNPVSSDPWGDDWQLSSLQFMKQLNPELKVHLIVGGWPKELPFEVLAVNDREEAKRIGRHNPAAQFTIYLPPAAPTGALAQNEFYVRRWVDAPDGNGGIMPPDSEPQGHPAGVYPELYQQLLPGWYKDMDQHRQLFIQDWLSTQFNIKILPAADLFSYIGKTPKAVQNFARSLVRAVMVLGFDGIELDWEYPSEADGTGFVAILEALRQAEKDLQDPSQKQFLRDAWIEVPDDKKLLLSIAAPADPKKIKRLDKYWLKIGSLVDTINVMTYDYGGTWLQNSDFNAPMRPVSTATPACGYEAPSGVRETMTAMLGYADKLCFTRRQLSLGLAIYGRGLEVDGVTRPATVSEADWNNGINRPVRKAADGQFNDGTGTYLYNYIATEVRKGSASDKLPGLVASSYLHPVARAPYLFVKGEGGRQDTLITYDNPNSVREKIRYAKQECLGGVMAWDLSGDLPPDDPQSILRAIGDEMRQERPASRAEVRKQKEATLMAATARDGGSLPNQRLWGVARDYAGTSVLREMPQGDRLCAVAALPGGRMVVGRASGVMQLLTPEYSQTPWQWQVTAAWKHANKAISLLDLPSGRILALLADGTLLCLSADVDGQAREHLVKKLPEAQDARLIPARGEQAFLVQNNSLLVVNMGADDNAQDRVGGYGLTGPDGARANIACALALPGGMILTGGARTDGIPTVGVWAIETGTPVFKGSPPRSQNEDWGDIVFLANLSDGSVAALTANGNYQVYGPSAFTPGHLQPAQWSVFAPDPLAGRALTALPQGGFLSITDGVYMLWNSLPSGGYMLAQRLPAEGVFQGVAVLDDGTVIIARDAESFLHIEARGWPRPEALLRSSWDWREQESGYSWLHHLAANGNAGALAQALAAGAPPELADDTGAQAISLIRTALEKDQLKSLPPLLAAGAPLWSVPDIADGNFFNDDTLAGLLPASLLAAYPHFVPELPPETPAVIPAETAGFLSDNPRLAATIVSTLVPILPAMAKAVQRVIQDFAVDDELLKTAAGGGSDQLMHLIVDESKKATEAQEAEGVGEDLRRVLDTLKGKRFEDGDALRKAIDDNWSAADKTRPWRVSECDQVINAAARPKRPDRYKIDGDIALNEQALAHFAKLVEAGWPIQQDGKPVSLMAHAPAHYRIVMEAGRSALTPDGYDAPLLRADKETFTMPPTAASLLQMAPFMADSLAAVANSLVSGLGALVHAYVGNERREGRLAVADVAAVQDPYAALADFDGGPALAGTAMQELIIEGTVSPRGGRLSAKAAVAFLARHAADPWIPQGSCNAFSQAWTAWSADSLWLPLDPRGLPEQTGNGVLPPERGIAQAKSGRSFDGPPDAPDLDDSRNRQSMALLRATQMKLKFQAWQNGIRFDSTVEDREIQRRKDSPFVQRMDNLAEDIAMKDMVLNRSRSLRSILDDLGQKPQDNMSINDLKKLGFFGLKPPEGFGETDVLPAGTFKDAIEKENKRLLKQEDDTATQRADSAKELRSLYRKQASDPLRQKALVEARAQKAQMKSAQRMMTKMQDYAMVSEQILVYGTQAINFLEDKGLNKAVASLLRNVLHYANMAVQIGTALATVGYAFQQMRAMQAIGSIGKGGGAMMMLSIGFTAFSLIKTAIFGADPDPLEEVYKALSKQIEEMANTILKSLEAMSEQMDSMGAGINKRIDGLEEKIDGLARELGQQVADMSKLMDENFALDRAEIRQSTAQVLLAMQRGFDTMNRRFDMLEDRLENDIRHLEEVMTVSLMNEYEEIDIAIDKSERDQVWAPEPVAVLADDPKRLVDYRNALVSGVRNKLLGLAPQQLENVLDSRWLQDWPLEVGTASAWAGAVAINRIGDCYDFYVRRGTGADASRGRIYFSSVYGHKLADRLLWVLQKMLRFSGNVGSMIEDLDELIIAPAERTKAFLTGLKTDNAFFGALFDDYRDTLDDVAGRCADILPGDLVQNWRLPAQRLGDHAFLQGLMFDRLPLLSLADLAAETVSATTPLRRDRYLSSFELFLNGPALGWRARRVLRVLALAHVFKVADLEITDDKETITLWVGFRGVRQPVAQLSLVADQIVDSRFTMTGNSLAIRIARACRPEQQRAVTAYNARIRAEAKGELAALDDSVARLIQFMTLAGLSEAGMAEALSMLWSSGRIDSYLSEQIAAPDGGAAAISPPVAVVLRSGRTTSARSETVLRAALAALPSWPEDDARRDPLPAHLIEETEDFLTRAKAYKDRLNDAFVPLLPSFDTLAPVEIVRLDAAERTAA
ncbi:glycosyl hydrolase family 18 protein [Janthinobacterium sp. SUN118]|uniref:glycosyl hydrolase family 18 protein n=1 Tax=Janthinobacterium sp. SUN118 TaxID=3004100 RepID=UPI0025AEEDDA|nr:glycosyl hydrolase family 18 protein [Janthinobacterium sp. SUN118]MDN2709855.1 glycosyl hydrolase family 18 protein [Janthinobacterium sp. SUN118]